jgi:glycerol uptake facilitator-like aquaporin
MNPAVTIGVLAAGAIGVGEAVGYIISQLIGGVAGALLLRTVLGGIATGLGTPALAHGLVLGATTVTITPEAGFVIEALLAFFLVTVVLSTAVAGRAGNLAPLAIGMTLTLNIIMGGALTGAPFNPRAIAYGQKFGESERKQQDCSTFDSALFAIRFCRALLPEAICDCPAFNPARALGPMVATGNFSDAWLYMTAPIVGAIVAAFLHTGLTKLAPEEMSAAKRNRAAQTPAG